MIYEKNVFIIKTNISDNHDLMLTSIPKEILCKIADYLSPRSRARLSQTSKSLSHLSILPDTNKCRKIIQNQVNGNLTKVIHPIEEIGEDDIQKTIESGEIYYRRLFGDIDDLNKLEKTIVSATLMGYDDIVFELINYIDDNDLNSYLWSNIDEFQYTINSMVTIASVIGDHISIFYNLNISTDEISMNIYLREAFEAKSKNILTLILQHWSSYIDKKTVIDLIFKYDLENLPMYVTILYQVDEGSGDQNIVYRDLVDQIVKHDRIDLAKIHFIKNYFTSFFERVTDEFKIKTLKNIIDSNKASTKMKLYINDVIEDLINN